MGEPVCACERTFGMRACSIHQAERWQMHAEMASHRHARIHEKTIMRRRLGQRFAYRYAQLEPFDGFRMLAVGSARQSHEIGRRDAQARVVVAVGQSVNANAQCMRCAVVGRSETDQAQPVERPTERRRFGQQVAERLSALERSVRFLGGHAVQLRARHPALEHQRKLERESWRLLRTARQQRERLARQADRFDLRELLQRSVGGVDIVA